MKAVQLNALGRGLDGISVVDLPDPAAVGPGEVEVAILAAPINPSDIIYLSGRYFHAIALPFCPGSEAVGRIVRVGKDVEGLQPGDLVLVLTVGNWVQRRIVSAKEVHKVPETADLLQLAMLRVNPGTAWLMLHHIVSLNAGDWIIQNAANSALGALVRRFAKEMGCQIVNVVRRSEAVEAMRLSGAEMVVVDGPDLRQEVRAVIGDAPIRLGLDAVAGDAAGRIAACLCVGGHLVTYGMLSGEDCRVSSSVLIGSELTHIGFRLRGERMRGSPVRDVYDQLAARLVHGEIFGTVAATYPLDQIAAALEIQAGTSGAKVILLPNGPIA